MSRVKRRDKSNDRGHKSGHDFDSNRTGAATAEAAQKRHANLYDAVAGRVTTTAPLGALKGSSGRLTSNRDGLYSLQDSALAPEEVLFRRLGAPTRYAERDLYFSHADREPAPGALPDSDLLKAMHGFASRFYEALGSGGGKRIEGVSASGPAAQCFVGSRHVDERSMDETALLAFGILLEEAGREVLGRRGDLVFTEGLEDAEADGDDAATAQNVGDGDDAGRRSREEVPVGPSRGELSWKRDYPKRRKRNDDASADEFFTG